jgi:hypothetical protein
MLLLIPTGPIDPYASPMHCLAFGTWLRSVYHHNKDPLSSSDVLGSLDSAHLPPEEGKIDEATEIEYYAIQTTRHHHGLNLKRCVRLRRQAALLLVQKIHRVHHPNRGGPGSLCRRAVMVVVFS